MSAWVRSRHTARPSKSALPPISGHQNWLGLRLLQCFGSSAIFAVICRASLFDSNQISDCGTMVQIAPYRCALGAANYGEWIMIRLVTRGRFTHDYLKGLLAAPEDREAAVRKVIEAVGGKVISFYVTTGETDFLLVSEADEAEGIIAALMAAAAAGTISDVRTGRAWTGAEFKSIMEKASKAAVAYRPPGKR